MVWGDGSHGVNRADVERWASYVTPTNITISLSTEAIYDWNSEDLALPLNFIVDQLVMFGDQPTSLGATAKYWAGSASGGPEGWGFRLQMTFIWPKS